MCTPSPCARTALSEATALWPNRSRLSDGVCPSAQHLLENPDSDHNDGSAFDLTHDPAHGVDCNRCRDQIIGRNDQRVKYLIFDGYIYEKRNGWKPEIYRRANKHRTHMHVSLEQSAKANTSPWWGGATSAPVSNVAGGFPIPDAIVPDAVEGAAAVFSFITSASTWRRLAYGLAGAGMVAGGTVFLVADLRAVKSIAGAVVDVVPGGKVVKAAGAGAVRPQGAGAAPVAEPASAGVVTS